MSGPMREGRDLHEAASAWVMAEEAGTVDNERLAARDAWLAEHPAHVAAYDAVQRAPPRSPLTAAGPRAPGAWPHRSWRGSPSSQAVQGWCLVIARQRRPPRCWSGSSTRVRMSFIPP